MKRLKVVFVDDNEFERKIVQERLNSDGLEYQIELIYFRSPDEFLNELPRLKFHVALLDVYFGDAAEMTGIELARITREKRKDVAIILRTSSPDAVTEFVDAGADDFLLKDQDGIDREIRARVIQAYIKRHPNTLTGGKGAYDVSLVGESMRRVSLRIESVVDSAVRTVHIHGESGTGKEVVADLINARLDNRAPFIRVNCAEFNANVVESELFGHKKGSFTGAATDKMGLFASAHGGWIFLDEVATLPLSVQAKLLRAIENREIRRVGENQPRKVNVKVASATNENLAELVEKGEFRRDLWQRLTEEVIELEPLRTRATEVEELAKYFAETEEGGPYVIEKGAMTILRGCSWRENNVRELRNAIRAMTVSAVNRNLGVGSIPAKVLNDYRRSSGAGAGIGDSSELFDFGTVESVPSFKLVMSEVFAKYARAIRRIEGDGLSMRRFESICKINRQAVSRRFSEAIQDGSITMDEVREIVPSFEVKEATVGTA